MNLRTFFRKLTTLQIALGASIAVHALVLGWRAADPMSFNRVFQDTPLEVILVNSKSTERPDKAKAIAQASLAGGGDAAQGRATSMLAYSSLTTTGESTEDSNRKNESVAQEQQNQLMAQIRNEIAAMPLPDPSKPTSDPENLAREQKRMQRMKLLAEIERRINEENARPKKRYISPNTREEAYAVYYDQLRRKIEEKGTTNFPESNGRKLYGEVLISLTVNHDGRVMETHVEQSSGNPVLDRRAEAIAVASAPFGAFDDAMRRQNDQIVLVSLYRFNRDQTLQTQQR